MSDYIARLCMSIALACVAFCRTAFVIGTLVLWSEHQFFGVALCMVLFWLSSELIGWLVNPVRVNGTFIRMCQAIETAIQSEDGLDWEEGAGILRSAGYWAALAPPGPKEAGNEKSA